MSDEQYRKVFVKKLHYYMDLKNINQADLINDLGLSSSTVSNWCTGQKMPRMGKIQMLADYFGIEKSDLIEEKQSETETNQSQIQLKSKEHADLAEVINKLSDEQVQQALDYIDYLISKRNQ